MQTTPHQQTFFDDSDRPVTAPQRIADRVRRHNGLIPAVAVLSALCVAVAGATYFKRDHAAGSAAYPNGSVALDGLQAAAAPTAPTQQTPLSAQAEAAGIGGSAPVGAVGNAGVTDNVSGRYTGGSAGGGGYAGGYAAPQRAAQAPVCRDCGTVESVQAVRHAGQGSGVGAVAGGLIGGLLGNQIGGGSGRALATVAGAVGGGYAGNYIEKNQKAYTTYRMQVRMQDGSVRTVEQSSAVPAGSSVRVEGNRLRVAATQTPYDGRS